MISCDTEDRSNDENAIILILLYLLYFDQLNEALVSRRDFFLKHLTDPKLLNSTYLYLYLSISISR